MYWLIQTKHSYDYSPQWQEIPEARAQNCKHLFRMQTSCSNLGANLPLGLPQVWSQGQEDPLEKGMATHPSIFAWRIPWTEKTAGYNPWGGKESDTTEATQHAHNLPLALSYEGCKSPHSWEGPMPLPLQVQSGVQEQWDWDFRKKMGTGDWGGWAGDPGASLLQEQVAIPSMDTLGDRANIWNLSSQV